MKKVKYTLILVMFFCLAHLPVSFGEAPKISGEETGNLINRSAAIIRTAQRFAVEGKKYDGLGLSVGHQLYARQLYMEGDYPNAGFHSLRARRLAAGVISLNKNSIINEALYNRNEERLVRNAPSDRELDRRLKETEVEIIDDKTAVNVTDLEV